MNLKSIINLLGILLAIFSISFLPPFALTFLYQEDGGEIFLYSFLSLFFFGGLMWFMSRQEELTLNISDGFIITTLFWVVLALAGSIPFYFFNLDLSFSSALFESVSGITTTGATTIVGLDELPKSILMYRQLLQWIGGAGLIVLAVAVMPALGIGGGQLYKTELPGSHNNQKLTPRIADSARALWKIYVGLTLACALLYSLSGMTSFDAIAHSLSTVAGGGFSTHDDSIGFFNSALIEGICIIFMLLSAASFAVHYAAIFGGKPLKYFYDPEFKFFLSVVGIIATISVLVFILSDSSTVLYSAFRAAIFHTVSIITTSGFTTEEFSEWPGFLPYLLLVGAFMGACSQSVGGGIKAWRVLIMLNQVYIEVVKTVHPKVVLTSKIGSKVIDAKIAEKVWGFFSIYVFIFMFLLLAMLGTGLDFESSFAAVGACLNNLGPGLADVAENYIAVTGFGKLILCFAMILGRLEIFALLVLFTPAFWRR
ncbi:potassium transporter [Gammaproteobacteria bacterium]|jgi:trk system potassium uptake protein TrkH|nr:potassium transporter [Gammaproteobacteria bacterium]|tara:strand:+ start:1382 stop:2830 length:1449 start_codon:yes stop_codon:yes gene_type:complete